MKFTSRKSSNLPAARKFSVFALSLLCALGMGVGYKLQAAVNVTYVWNPAGTTINWNLAGNWNTLPPSSTNSILEFGADSSVGTANGNVLNDDFANLFSLGGIVFDSGDPAYTFGGNSITLGAATVNVGVVNNSSSTQTINNNILWTFASGSVQTSGAGVTFGGLVTYNIGGGATSLFNSSLTTFSGGLILSNAATGRNVAFDGTGNLLISSAITPNATASGAQTLLYNGSGTLALSNANGGSISGVGANTTTLTIATGAAAITGSTGNSTLLIRGNYTIGAAGQTGLIIKGGDGVTKTQGTLSLEDGGINTLNINSSAAAATVLTMGQTTAAPTVLSMDVGNNTSDQIALGTGEKASIGNVSGAVLVNLNGIGGLTTTGTYTLLNAQGTTLTLSNFSLNSTTGNFGGFTSVGLVVTSGSLLQVTVGGSTATPGTAFWSGTVGSAGSGTWNTFVNGGTNSTNWTTTAGGSTDTHQVPGSTTNVIFSSVPAGGGNVNTVLGANTSISSLEFTAASAAVTIGSGTFGAGSSILTIGAGGITVDSSALAQTISANVTLGSSQTWTNNSTSSPLTVSGSISGSGLTVGGAGQVVISGNNTGLTGGLTINNATVKLGSAGALNSTTPNSVTFGASSTGVLALNGQSVTIGALSTNATAGTPVIQDGSSANATLTGSQTTNTTYAGVLQDGGAGTLSFVKAGSGVLTLTGANTYSGSTAIVGGRLQVNNSLASSSVTVNSGTLGGSGSISGGVTVGSGGKIMPGTSTASTATLTLGSSGITINSGGIAAFNINSSAPSNDFINDSTGTVTLASGAILQVTGGIATSGVYTLITGNSTINLTGVVLQDMSGASLASADPTYSITQSGNSIILTISAASTAIPGITIITPLSGTRVMQNTANVGVTGNVTNTGVVALNGTLSSSGGNLTVSNFAPTTGTFQTAVSGTTAYSGTIANVGSTLGTNTFNVTVTDGAANPPSQTASGTLNVLQNRVISASTAAIGPVHVNASGTATTTLTSLGADNSNTRLTVANATNGGGTVSGGANPTFNGSASDTRNVTATFGSLGNQGGTVNLTTSGEGLAGETDASVGVGYTAQVFSGTAAWSLNGNSSWSTNGNWADTAAADSGGAGAPGLAGAASATDVAIFNDVSGQAGLITVSLNGVSPTLAGITFNSTFGYSIVPGSGGNINLLGAATPILVSTGSDTITAQLTGLGLNKTGPGLLILGGANSYTGATQVSSGTLQATISNALPTTTVLTLGDVANDSGQFVLGNSSAAANQTLAGLSTVGTGATNSVVAGGNAAFSNLTINVASGINTYAGALGGSGAQNNINVTKSGTGIQVFSGLMTYTGSTSVSGGVLQAPGALSNSTILTLVGTGTGGLGAIFQSNGTLTRSVGANSGNAGAGGINVGSFGGFSAQGGSFTVTLTGGALVWGTNFINTGGAGLEFGSTTSDSQLIFVSGFSLDNGGTGASQQKSIYVEKGVGGDSTLLSGIITDANTAAATGVNNGGDGIIKLGGGTLILGGANTYTGVTTVTNGTLKVTNNKGLGYGGVTNNATSGTVSVAAGTTLDLSNVTVNKVVSLSSGTLTNSSASATVMDNGVAQVLLNSGGSGYTAPSVTISGGGGTGATESVATLGLTAASINVSTNGSTYTVAPTVTITGGGGTGATATVNATTGVITITNPGSGYTSAPTIAFGPGTGLAGGTGFTATGNATNFTITGITNTAPGSGYTATASASATDATGSGASFTVVNSALVLAGNNTIAGTGNITINSVISGVGTLNVTNVATVTVTANNIYTGAVTVSAGTLQFGDGTTGHDGFLGTQTLVDNSTVSFDRFGTSTFSGTINGTGGVSVLGTGTEVFTGANVYNGATTIASGATLQLGDGTTGHDGTISGASIVDSGTLTYDRFGTSTYGGVISGGGNVIVEGPGTQVLTNANTYNGSTTIIAGSTLQLGDGTTGHDGTIGNSLSVVDGGSLVYDRFGTSTYSGVISGGGSVTVNSGASNVGTEIFTNANTYSGATTIGANATLQLGDGTTGHDGTIDNSPTIANSGALVYNRFGSDNYGGSISGGGSVTVVGTGTQTLSGNSGYTGATTVGNGSVGNGTLFVTGTLSATSGITVNAGAKIGGSGVVTSISGNGQIAPADGPSILTATSINPGPNMSFAFQFSSPVVGGTSAPVYATAANSGNDLLHLTGLSGTALSGVSLANTNTINIDFSAITGSLAFGQQYLGGFFLDDNTISNAAFNSATFTYTGQGSWTIVYEGLVPVSGASFATGGVPNGQEMEFEVIPEPSTYAMIFSGFGMLIGVQRMRRRRSR